MLTALLLTTALFEEPGFVAVTEIGKWEPPYVSSMAVDITADGEQIVYVSHVGCAFFQRINMINSDGTGYRTLLDLDDLAALYEPGIEPMITYLVVSGDGSTVAWSWNDSDFCDTEFAASSFVLDVETGIVNEVGPDYEFGETLVSFSDDAELMMFWGWEDGGHVVLAERAGPADYTKNVREILSPGDLGYNEFIPQVLRDGSGFVVHARENLFGTSNGDAFLASLDLGRVVRLTPETMPNSMYPRASYDGSRIVLASYVGPLYAVNGDGSDFRVLHPETENGAHNISSDGEWVVFEAENPAWPFTTAFIQRIRWDGTDLEPIQDVTTHLAGVSRSAISGDGSRIAVYSRDVLGPDYLTMAVFDQPTLTTYGFPEPGSTLHLDVAGPSGATWWLAVGRALAQPLRMPPYGGLQLHPANLAILATGVITSEQNVGQVDLVIPADPRLVGLEPHFQALVQWPGGGGLTNRTTVQFVESHD